MDIFLMIIAGLATVAFLVVSIIAGVAAHRRRQEAMGFCRYRPQKSLMVGSQRKCFQLLNDIFGGRFYVIPQVNVSALLNHKVGQNPYEAFSFIDNKTVDFVFCNKETLRPVCAVKLDEGKTPDRSLGADPKDMEKFFQSAHLPFVRISRPDKLDRQTVIEEFSRVVYETSLLEDWNKK